ncbi:MAG: UxaA family hydrolase [Synergistaceae bacterium]|nr:UxaA family hydrolase [Synergistaceae bacterium]
MKSVEYIRLSDADNVLVLPEGGETGREVDDAGSGVSFVIAENIPAWHKVACAPIASGKSVVKHGCPIGTAAADIPPGAWVHVHNTSDARKRARRRAKKRNARPGESDLKFRGYRRQEGRPGIRNELWVIPSAGLAAKKLEAILSDYHRQYWIDAVRIIKHPADCPLFACDPEAVAAILCGLVSNPNAAGVLLIGSGRGAPESKTAGSSASDVYMDGSTRIMAVQGLSPSEIAEHLDRLGGEAARVREEFPVSALCVGVRPERKDLRLALSLNPFAGRLSDWFASRGGTILAAKSPETLCDDEAAAPRISEKHVLNHLQSLSVQHRSGGHARGALSGEDLDGGLTTITEKNLLAADGSGHSQITAVLRPGEAVRDCGGVQITYAPDDYLMSGALLASGGAQIILSSAGICTQAETVVPTIEISPGGWLAVPARPEWIDFSLSSPSGGKSQEGDVENLAEYVLRVASGVQMTSRESGLSREEGDFPAKE